MMPFKRGEVLGGQYGVHLVMCPIKYCNQDISNNWCYASQHFTVLLGVRVIISLDPCTVTCFHMDMHPRMFPAKEILVFLCTNTEQQAGVTAHWSIQR